MATYKEKLLDPRWQKKRLQILERDEFSCRLCNDSKNTLHIHHTAYNNDPWDAKEEDLITYCLHCHSIIEWNKKKEKITPFKVIKRNLTNGECSLILLYEDESGDEYIDFYRYENNSCIYLTSVSVNFIEFSLCYFPSKIPF